MKFKELEWKVVNDDVVTTKAAFPTTYGNEHCIIFMADKFSDEDRANFRWRASWDQRATGTLQQFKDDAQSRHEAELMKWMEQ